MSLGFYSAISLVFSVASAVCVFQLCWPTTVWGLITLKGYFFFPMRTQLVETAKNICFGTDLHCSNVHSLISMAMIVTTNTSGPLW